MHGNAAGYTIQGLLGEQNNALERALRVNDDINARLRETLRFNLSINECFRDGRGGGEPSPSASSSSSLSPGQQMADRDRLPIGTSEAHCGGGAASDVKALASTRPSEGLGLYEPLISHRLDYDDYSSSSLVAPMRGSAELLPLLTPTASNAGIAPVGTLVRKVSEAGIAPVGTLGRQMSEEILVRETQLFPSPAEDIRRRVEKSLQSRIYNVENLYRPDGLAQRIARDHKFINLTLAVIMTNTLWIAVDTDYNKHKLLIHAPPIFQIMDNLFCTFFCFEITTRLFAFRNTMDALRDRWFVFDLFLVVLMVWETWIQVAMFAMFGNTYSGGARNTNVLRIFRIFRLARIARMARLLRSVPELMILVKGMATAMRSVFATLVLLIVVIYIFALVFTQLLAGEVAGEGKFDTVLLAMNFLLVQVTCGFDGDFVTELLNTGIMSWAIFLIFILVANMTIMNMLIGVLCEVVAEVAQQEKEEAFLKDVEAQIIIMVHQLDEDGSDEIGAEEFDKLVENPDMMNDLVDLGVDVVSFVEFTNFVLSEDGRALSAMEFFDLVIQFRGNKAATVKDIVDMRRFVSMELVNLEQKLLKDFRRS